MTSYLTKNGKDLVNELKNNKDFIEQFMKGNVSIETLDFINTYSYLGYKYLWYIIDNYSQLINSNNDLEINTGGRLSNIADILYTVKDTKLTDFMVQNNYTEGQLSDLYDTAISNYMDKNITKEQLDFIIYSKITDVDTINSIIKAFNEDKLSINQVKQMIKNDKSNSKNDKTETSTNELLNKLADQLNDVIDLTYGWEVYDDSISGTIDDDYSVDIYLKNDGNNTILEYENKQYTDIDTLIKNVIKDVKSYAKSVLNQYGEYPNYLERIK